MRQKLQGWPAGSKPRNSPVRARDQIIIWAEPDVIWGYLTRASVWPQWYPYSADVIVGSPSEQLGYGVQFDWTTFDVRVHSQVEEWKPFERIGWNARAILTHAYHRWTIEKCRDGFTQVVTEETQHGFLPFLLRWYLTKRLHRQHRTWLKNLKCLSEAF